MTDDKEREQAKRDEARRQSERKQREQASDENLKKHHQDKKGDTRETTDWDKPRPKKN